jgi:signal transduction histidine kinase
MDSPTRGGRGAPQITETELTERIHWFIRLRWLAAAGVVAASLGAVLILRTPLPLWDLLTVGAAVAAYNGAFVAITHRLTPEEGTIPFPLVRLLAAVQIAADLIALGTLLHFSGGVENPLSSFFAFHMIIAGILLSRELAYAQATLATLIFAAVVGLERYGLVSHVHLDLLAGPRFYTSDRVWLIVMALAATLYLLVYMTTSITGRLREREREEAELARQLAEKADALQRAYADLEATQKLQVQYMRRTSHELRSPLAAVASILDVVAEGLTGDVPPKQREMLDRSRAKLRHLLRLTDDLLTLLRARAAPPREQFQPVGLEHVIDSVSGLLAERAEQEGVRLSQQVSPGLPPVLGDPEMLTQLVTNLVANAIKYTPKGGSVRIEAEAGDGTVVLRVVDTGIGIAKEEQARIFDEFYRTRGGRQFATRGTGLGLSIVRSIADAHGAEVLVESGVGKGTTFTVRLPVPGGEAPA